MKKNDYLSTNGAYSIRLARTEEEKHVLKLRYDIFTLELKEGSCNVQKQDFDIFDKYCDFLILVNNKTEEIVGLYRILPVHKMSPDMGYYSETEFQLGKMPKASVAELGRLCIKKEHRGKGLLNLLWLGLIKYAKENGIRYYFGCGSLRPNTTKQEMQKIYWYLKTKRKIHKKYIAEPLPPSEVKKNLMKLNPEKTDEDFIDVDDSAIDVEEKQKIKRKEFIRLCPKLIRRYLKIGTKVLGKPAYDPYFKCYDFLIMIDTKKSKIKILNYFLNTQSLQKRLINKVFGKKKSTTSHP
jgi:putative hemolysin